MSEMTREEMFAAYHAAVDAADREKSAHIEASAKLALGRAMPSSCICDEVPWRLVKALKAEGWRPPKAGRKPKKAP